MNSQSVRGASRRWGVLIVLIVAVIGAGWSQVAGAVQGDTSRVSVDSAGVEADSHAWEPAISADGIHVAFRTDASNLVPGDGNGVSDVVVHDRETGVTSRVSVDSNGIEGNNDS